MFKRADSAKDYSAYMKIKDFHYFKLLLADYDISIIKDYFLHSLQTLALPPDQPYQLDANYCYIASQDMAVRVYNSEDFLYLKEGYLIQERNQVIVSTQVCVLYRIMQKTQIILKKLFFLDLPILKGIKNSEKIQFYELCSVLRLDFGRFIYKKGEAVDAIYYIMEGQIKILKRRKEKIFQIASLEKGRIFGAYQFKQEKMTRELFSKAGQNFTQVLIIPKTALELLCTFREVRIERILEQLQSSQLSYTFLAQKKKQKPPICENQRPKQTYSLQKRVKGYQNDNFIQNNLLQDLAHSKTLFHKINDLTKMSKFKSQDFKIVLNNATDVKHFNDKWKRNKQLNRHTVTAPSYRELFTSDSLKRSFAGLHKYPSVKEYQTKRSKMLNINLLQ